MCLLLDNSEIKLADIFGPDMVEFSKYSKCDLGQTGLVYLMSSFGI